MVDRDEFFREATLRVCGSLEIEDGLHACFQYIGQYLPADIMYLQRYYPDQGEMRIVAGVRADGGRRMEKRIPLPRPAKDNLARTSTEYRERRVPVFVYNRPRESPLAMGLLRALDDPISSVLVLPLEVGGEFAGSLAILAEGENRFSDDHIDLYATLREPLFVAFSNFLKHEEVVQLRDRLADDNRYLNRELLRLAGDEIIGADFGLRDVMHQVQHVAATDTPVLLTGETGSGKDVIANAIHLTSERRQGPFIPVNCGAIPDSLIDSELFGHEKGAFTGALTEKRGRFERADGGTIMLDEIGEMPMEAQVRLLRVIQHREVERLGGTERIPVNIRIIAATHQDLPQLVREGKFREDLLFRLNVFPIVVPPLRERSGDIPALVQFFIERKTKELKTGEMPQLAPGAIDVLKAYRWPGNVRELENVIERAMILCHGEPLRFDELDINRTDRSTGDTEGPLELDAFIANHIRKVLDIAGGKVHGPGGAAELLGVNANTLRYRMKKLGIPFGRESSG